MQICKKCNLELSLDNFHKMYKNDEKRHVYCKKCASEYENRYIIQNKLKLESGELLTGEKTCTKCNQIKQKTQFNIALTKSTGLSSHCKDCIEIYTQNNKEKLKIYKKEHREKNIDKILKRDREYYYKNKQRIQERNKQYKKDHPEVYKSDKTRETKRIYCYKNRERIKQQLQARKAKNPELYRRRFNETMRKHRKNNPQAILAIRVRNNLRLTLKENNIIKFDSTENILGCSFEFFKKYIESLFTEGMTWDLLMQSQIELDHKIPLCSVDLTLPQNLRMVCHYTNIRPSWERDNNYKAKLDKLISIHNPKNPHILRHIFDFDI